MSAQPVDHKRLASELTEADIAEIIRAKAPEKIRGTLVNHVGISWSGNHDGSPFIACQSVTIHCGARCVAVGMESVAAAVAYIEKQMKTPAEEARELRSRAYAMIAHAAALEKEAA